MYSCKCAKYKQLRVFKLKFDRGEFDMVIHDLVRETCRLFEIKHTTERDKISPCDNPPIGIVPNSVRDGAVICCMQTERKRNLFVVKYHTNLLTEGAHLCELQHENVDLEKRICMVKYCVKPLC